MANPKDLANVPAFIINTTYRIKAEDTDAFAALSARMATNAKSTKGCLFLHAAQDVLDRNTFRLFEGWEGQEAFDAHIASGAFQGILSEAMNLRITERFGDIISVSGMNQLEMPT